MVIWEADARYLGTKSWDKKHPTTLELMFNNSFVIGDIKNEKN